jgi:hypothetical protein
MALGTATVTEITDASCRKIVWAWTAGSAVAPAQDGGCTKATVYGYDGAIIGLTTIPGTGADEPSVNYDVTITDSAGHDVLLGAGMNRHNTNTEHVAQASLAGVARSVLTLNVAAAGTSNTGTAVLYIR